MNVHIATELHDSVAKCKTPPAYCEIRLVHVSLLGGFTTETVIGCDTKIYYFAL